MRSHSAIKKLQRTGLRQKFAKLQLVILTKGRGASAKREIKLPDGVHTDVSIKRYSKQLHYLYQQVFSMRQVFTPEGNALHQQPRGYSKKQRFIQPVVQNREKRLELLESFVRHFFKKSHHHLYL